MTYSSSPAVAGPRAGPLAGLKVVELAALGPAPHAAMLLADQGADVVRIVRPSSAAIIEGVDLAALMRRGKREAILDLKQAADLDRLRALIARADVVIEGMRPGVAERLGIGPVECIAANPGLIYARMTGFGQSGPLAQRAGHDINYLAVSGLLDLVGRAGAPPTPPLNLVADFGGGSMFLVFGILAALWERQRTARGQIIDAAMVDGVATLAEMTWELAREGAWSSPRGRNLLDSGAPFYDVYACQDGKFVAVGALEPRFYQYLLDGLALDPAELLALPGQYDRDGWPRLREIFRRTFLTRTRDDWAAVFADSDACVSPVLSRAESIEHEHFRSRLLPGQDVNRSTAPRFSGHLPSADASPQAAISVDDLLAEWGPPRSGSDLGRMNPAEQ
jgi:alpha-methylacyl-CoA racemase